MYDVSDEKGNCRLPPLGRGCRRLQQTISPIILLVFALQDDTSFVLVDSFIHSIHSSPPIFTIRSISLFIYLLRPSILIHPLLFVEFELLAALFQIFSLRNKNMISILH